MKVEKITSIILYALVIVSVVVLVICATLTPGSMVLSDGSEAEDPHVGAMLALNYVLIAIAIVVTIISAANSFMIKLKTDKKGAFLALGGMAGLILVMVITYAIADDSMVKLIGYDGDENVGASVKVTTMFLDTSYILLGLGVLSIIASPLIKRMK